MTILAERITRVILRGLEILFAVLLFWSAAEHLKNPFLFLSSILKYEMLAFAAPIIAVFFPVFQLLLAALLCLQEARLMAVACTATLFSIFALAQAIALLRGLGIACGCFGVAHSYAISSVTVATIVSLSIVAWCVFYIEFRDACQPNLRARALLDGNGCDDKVHYE